MENFVVKKASQIQTSLPGDIRIFEKMKQLDFAENTVCIKQLNIDLGQDFPPKSYIHFLAGTGIRGEGIFFPYIGITKLFVQRYFLVFNIKIRPEIDIEIVKNKAEKIVQLFWITILGAEYE